MVNFMEKVNFLVIFSYAYVLRIYTFLCRCYKNIQGVYLTISLLLSQEKVAGAT